MRQIALHHSPNSLRRLLSLLSGLLIAAAILGQRAAPGAPAQGLTSTPTPSLTPSPAAGTFDEVQVQSGNTLQRNPGQETQPPVWVTIQANGSRALVTVGNATRFALDFTGTVVIELEPGVAPVDVAVSIGTAAVQGNRIIWNNFSLTAGQIVPAIINLTASGGAAQASNTAPAIRSISVEATEKQSGTRVLEQAAAGGPTLAALAATAPATNPLSRAPTPVASSNGSRTSDRLLAGGTLGLLLGGLIGLVLVYRRISGLVQRIEGAAETFGVAARSVQAEPAVSFAAAPTTSSSPTAKSPSITPASSVNRTAAICLSMRAAATAPESTAAASMRLPSSARVMRSASAA